MAGRLDTVRKSRLQKLEALRKKGLDPYPAKYHRTHSCKDAAMLEGHNVSVAGRVWAIREHGGVSFVDIKDASGKIQAYLQKDKLGEESYKNLSLLDVGDFLGAEGKVFKTKKGEPTVHVSSWQLLAKSIRPLPSKWHGLKDAEERYRQRYVDLLMNKEVYDKALARNQLVGQLRNFLDIEGFIEVETPILQPVYGGAAARPFTTHHHALGTDLYLRISDELYLKRLIVGGFEKVYEIGRDFRNEGVDRQHNPEFTQIEFYWAYVDYLTLAEFVEKMLTSLIQKIKGELVFEYQGKKLDFTPPWKRITFRDLLLHEAGIDIDIENTEEKLKETIKNKKLSVETKGAVGFGALVDRLYKNVVRPKIIQPTFLLDYPAEMIALAKRKENEPGKIASFQVLVSGFEIVKAYNELNDPQDQKARWEEMDKLGKKGLEEHETLDEDYIRALEYGMPPTAGCGIGIDRVTALLTDSSNIKEVILFPTLRPTHPLHKASEGKQK